MKLKNRKPPTMLIIKRVNKKSRSIVNIMIPLVRSIPPAKVQTEAATNNRLRFDVRGVSD
jgi:hypothetical protein